MAFVEVSDAKGSRQVALDREVVTVGRDPSNDIALVEQRCSRRHCEIRRQGAGYRIVDMGSSNGTFLGGDKIKEAALNDGDVVEIGQAKLIFSADAALQDEADEDAAAPDLDDLAAPALDAEDAPAFDASKLDDFAGTVVEDDNRVHLECLAGKMKGQEFDLTRIDELTMGRGPKNHVTLLDRRASGSHCRWRRDAEHHRYFVEDLGSTNGTLLNGQAMEARREYELSHEDEVTIGDTVFVMQHPRQAEALRARFSEKKQDKVRQARRRAEEKQEERSKTIFLVAGVLVAAVIGVSAWYVLRGAEEKEHAEEIRRQAQESVPAIEGNLLGAQEFSFEAPWGAATPSGWDISVENADNAKVMRAKADAKAGAKSGSWFMRFDLGDVRSSTRVRVKRQSRLSVAAGEDYLASAWVRTPKSQGVVGLQLVFTHGDIPVAVAASDYRQQADDWTQLSVNARVPPGADKAQYVLVAAGRARQIDVDHLLLAKVSGGRDFEPFSAEYNDPYDGRAAAWTVTVDHHGELSILGPEGALLRRARWEYVLDDKNRSVVNAFEFANFVPVKDPSHGTFVVSGQVFECVSAQWYRVQFQVRVEPERLVLDLLSRDGALPPAGEEFALVGEVDEALFATGLQVRTDADPEHPLRSEGAMQRLVVQARELALLSPQGRMVVAVSEPSTLGIVATQRGPQFHLRWPEGRRRLEIELTGLSPTTQRRFDREFAEAGEAEGNDRFGEALRRYRAIADTMPEYVQGAARASQRAQDLDQRAERDLARLKTAAMQLRGDPDDEAARQNVFSLASKLRLQYEGTPFADQAGAIIQEFGRSDE